MKWYYGGRDRLIYYITKFLFKCFVWFTLEVNPINCFAIIPSDVLNILLEPCLTRVAANWRQALKISVKTRYTHMY